MLALRTKLVLVKILLAAAEFSPLVRTGGLGEAVAGLAHALVDLGHEVSVAIPSYADLGTRGRKLRNQPWRAEQVDGLTVGFFLDKRFNRPGVYGPEPGTGYPDNWERFAAFSAAIAGTAKNHDIVHLHDGHVGPAALRSTVPTVFTIHNASYALVGPLDETARLLGLSEAEVVAGGAIEWFGEANFLKAGIVGSDVVTTVSPTHAVELTVEKTSFGLSGIATGLPRPIVGVLNGIDTGRWDPSADDVLEATFSVDYLEPRARNRAALLAAYDLDDGFVLGNVGRLTSQKGLQLLDYDIDALIEEGVRFVFVGNGELDALIDGWVGRHPTTIAHVPFTEVEARKVFAGVDAYLMPSEYEPCGLGQMYAMRYGAPPIAHAVGGLADTVIDIDEDTVNGTGFVFRSFNHASLTKTIRRAMRYRARVPKVWAAAVATGMRGDRSWRTSAARYVELYSAVAGA